MTMIAAQPVLRSRLCDLSGLVGNNYRLASADAATDSPVLHGRFFLSELRPGLILRCADTRDLHALHAEADMRPALKLVIVLDGCADVSFGSRRLRWPDDEGAAALVALTRPERFVRRARRGNRERSLTLTLTQEWLGASPLAQDGAWESIRAFSERHLAMLRWQPSPRMRALASQMAWPTGYAPGLQSLYQESRSIELVGEALAMLGRCASPAVPAMDERLRRKLERLRDFLESGEADDATLARIAREAGINVNAMQRGFRLLTGVPVVEYLRRSRLGRARQALERDAVSVAEAASIAGYASAANFSTAFRRQFGMTPREARFSV